MSPLELEWSRCPDGVRVVETHKGRFFESRTEIREAVRYELRNLEDTLIVRFLNATHPDVIRKSDKRKRKPIREFASRNEMGKLVKTKSVQFDIDAGFASFFSRFGLPISGTSMPWNFAEGQHDEIAKLFWAATGGYIDQTSEVSVQEFNRLISEWRGYSVMPTLRHPEMPDGTPRLIYRVNNLLAFMAMEAALIAEAGAKAKHCENCLTLFIHGPLTGRRSHAEYCSDKCRVAALRRRNKVGKGA